MNPQLFEQLLKQEGELITQHANLTEIVNQMLDRLLLLEKKVASLHTADHQIVDDGKTMKGYCVDCECVACEAAKL